MRKASLILSWKDVEAMSRIEKQSFEHIALHASGPFIDVLNTAMICYVLLCKMAAALDV